MPDMPIDMSDAKTDADELLKAALKNITSKVAFYGAHCAEMAKEARLRIEELECLLAQATLMYGGIPLVEALEEIKDENHQLRAIIDRRRDKALEDLHDIRSLKRRATKSTDVPKDTLLKLITAAKGGLEEAKNNDADYRLISEWEKAVEEGQKKL